MKRRFWGKRKGVPIQRRLTVHPLFFLVGILSAFTGGLLTFLSACVAAVEHECAHAFAAKRYGFSLDKIVLMPYGAVISGDLSALSPKEEFAVAVAGPLANALTACFFVALWWFYPDTYPYTETAAFVSVSLFVVNLLPAYPLDGGRILGIALRPLGKKRAKTVLTCVTFLIAGGIFAYFVYTCFSAPDVSALLFSCLLAAGAFGKHGYSKIRFSEKGKLCKGVEEKRVALSADRTLKDALRFLRDDRYLVLVLYDGEEFLGELTESEYVSALGGRDYSTPLKNCLPEFAKGA